MTLPNGPTLNPEYNGVLNRWRKAGFGSPPQCEECACDLTGLEVIETHSGWYCRSCADKVSGDEGLVDVDEARAERRQMGLTAL